MNKSHYINGEWLEGEGKSFKSLNPSNGESIWEGKEATEKEVDSAMKSAKEAFSSWANLDFNERLAFVEKFIENLKSSREEFAKLISIENGKPFWEANMEAGGMINKLAISKDAHEERTGNKKNDLPNGTQAQLRHRPHGVVAVFAPFNFPGHLPNGHIIPALLAGNTIVLKPSELTPKVSEKMVELWAEAGLPKGVINLVQGASSTGIALSNHPDIDGLFFTGSSETGKIIHKQFGGQPNKILALEMGGNNPLVVMGPYNVEATAYTIIQSAFITSGQRCTCARRLILKDEKKSDELIEKLKEMISNIKVGDGLNEPAPFMGPLISNSAASVALEAEAKLINDGAKPIVKLEALDLSPAFLRPGLIDVSDLKKREDKEVFGPLLKIIKVKDFDEAIKEANNTEYGLAAGLISDDSEYYEKFLKEIKAGLINWNNQLTGASSSAPFGGVGCSGNHRPSAYYAADYCAYPVASLECNKLELPEAKSPGLS